MIDLNDLLKNIDTYKAGYALKKQNADLDYFVFMEDSRKQLQLDTEKMRALCNKLCGEVARFREKNKDTDELIAQIVMLDKVINENNKTLDRYNKIINKRLAKLHNLPIYDNKYNEQLATNKNADITYAKLEELIKENVEVETYNGKIQKYFKEKRNFLFEEDKMPKFVKAKNGYTILCAAYDVEKIQKAFLDFFAKNALSLIKVSSAKLHWANNASFYVHLNHKESFYFEINKEYCTRECNIKYRSKDIDMTKFVNQINILLRR